MYTKICDNLGFPKFKYRIFRGSFARNENNSRECVQCHLQLLLSC